MNRSHVRARNHGHPRFRQVALHGVASEDSGSFEADLVLSIGIGDVYMTGRRIDGHVKRSGADMRESGGLGKPIRIQGEQIQIRQAETNRSCPRCVSVRPASDL